MSHLHFLPETSVLTLSRLPRPPSYVHYISYVAPAQLKAMSPIDRGDCVSAIASAFMQLAHSVTSLVTIVRELREGGKRLRQLMCFTTHDSLMLGAGVRGERRGGGRGRSVRRRSCIKIDRIALPFCVALLACALAQALDLLGWRCALGSPTCPGLTRHAARGAILASEKRRELRLLGLL